MIDDKLHNIYTWLLIDFHEISKMQFPWLHSKGNTNRSEVTAEIVWRTNKEDKLTTSTKQKTTKDEENTTLCLGKKQQHGESLQ